MYRFSEFDATDGSGGHRNDISVSPCFLLMDAERRILQASPAAYRLIEESPHLSLVCGTLRATDSADGATLTAAFHAVLHNHRSTCVIQFGDGDLRTEVQLVPLSGGDAPGIIAIVTWPTTNMADRLDRAARRYGLTPAESRLLASLCSGLSLQQAAVRLDVAHTTTRTHLQRIFEKSGTHRQGELIRQVLVV